MTITVSQTKELFYATTATTPWSGAALTTPATAGQLIVVQVGGQSNSAITSFALTDNITGADGGASYTYGTTASGVGDGGVALIGIKVAVGGEDTITLAYSGNTKGVAFCTVLSTTGSGWSVLGNAASTADATTGTQACVSANATDTPGPGINFVSYGVKERRRWNDDEVSLDAGTILNDLTVSEVNPGLVAVYETFTSEGSLPITLTTTGTATTVVSSVMSIAETTGTTAVSFSGSTAAQEGNESVAFSYDLSTEFSGSQTPFVYSIQSGTLPAGITLGTGTGILSGTPTVPGVYTGIVVRATDQDTNTADSTAFTITIYASGTIWDITRLSVVASLNAVDITSGPLTATEWAISRVATSVSTTTVSFTYVQSPNPSETYTFLFTEGTGTTVACDEDAAFNATVDEDGWTLGVNNNRYYPIHEGTGATLDELIGGYDATIQNFTDEWS